MFIPVSSSIVSKETPSHAATLVASTMSTSKPTVVFVPGAFHTPNHFTPLTELLQASSYPSLTVSLPSIGAQAATGTLTDDIQAVRAVLERLIEQEGKDVVLAAHSYGGVPACQTVNGLEKSKRANGGKKGGVIHVLFIAALLVEEGKALVDALGGGLPPWAEAEVTCLPLLSGAPLPCDPHYVGPLTKTSNNIRVLSSAR